MRVLFLCTGNSCRSQMAEGMLRALGGNVLEVESAGAGPKPVHPGAVRAMSEIDIDISRQRSKHIDLFIGTHFDYVITLCDSAKESCPVFPDAAARLHWSIPDPAAVEGSDEQRMQAFRGTRDQIAAHIDELLTEIFEGLLDKLAAQFDAYQAELSFQE